MGPDDFLAFYNGQKASILGKNRVYKFGWPRFLGARRDVVGGGASRRTK
jgi:hypothetical protein